MPINTRVSAWTYQNLDGSNFSLAGLDASVPVGCGNLGVHTGMGSSFKKSSTAAIIDFKGSMKYGKSPLSGDFRLRHKLNSDTKIMDLRLQPLVLDLPISKSMNYYINPYYLYRHNYSNNSDQHYLGVYSGFCKKLGNFKLFLEAQFYNLKNVTKESVGFNAGVSINLRKKK